MFLKENNQRVEKNEVKWIFLFKDKDTKEKWAADLQSEINRIRANIIPFTQIENNLLQSQSNNAPNKIPL